MLIQTRRLPLLVAVAAFVLYACTMGGELTLNGLSLASKLTGWDAAPMTGQPVLWLLTLPLQLLPAAWVPLLLKLLSSLLAAAVLGLLARSVQLLPWDHPWESDQGFTCMLPVLTAVVVCGLEFSFWQQATSTCGDLLDVLLLAAASWLLLEYNVRRQSEWLNAAALVWGLGMAQNWVMLMALPLFVAALIRLRGTLFFRWKFILRLAGLGLAGFSVYAVLPLANSLLPHSPWTLGQAWSASLRETQSFLLLPGRIWHVNRLVTLAVAISFLVPTLPLLVRLRDEGTKNKSGADIFQVWIYRVLRLGLLLACFWLAFDPNPGAQQMIRQAGVRTSLLTFDYLNALGAAFVLGNLLLVSQAVFRDPYRRSRGRFPWRRLATPIAAAILALVAAGLAVRNAPAIVHLNFYALERFGDLAVKSLPAGRGVVLSDRPDQLLVFQAALARANGAADWLAVDTHALPTVRYRARLERRLPVGWLTDETRHELTSAETLRLVEQVARTNRLFYLHPSHGTFFESFYLEPTGTIYEMKLRGQDPLELPPLSSSVVDANEQFWTRLWGKELAAEVEPPPPRPTWWSGKMARLSLTAAPRDQDRLLRDWLSISLEGWAVALQRQGRLREAHERLDQALGLNTNNPSARLTLDCNTNLQAGRSFGLSAVPELAGQLGNLDRLDRILEIGGPFDQPDFCYMLGSLFSSRGFLVQATEQLERVKSLAPGWLAPEVDLAAIYNELKRPDRSLRLVQSVRGELTNRPSWLDLNLALLESDAWRQQTNLANARDALQSVLQQYPDDPEIGDRVISAYLALSDLTNALEVIEDRLAASPDNVENLNLKARILMQSNHAAAALLVWDHILELTNQPVVFTNLPAVRINRAFALIAIQDFARAKRELNELETSGQHASTVDFALGLVAAHDENTNSARHYFQLCLSNTPDGEPVRQQASAHLQMLEPGTAANRTPQPRSPPGRLQSK